MVEITVINQVQLEAKLAMAPAVLDAELIAAGHDAGENILKPAIEADTPSRTGYLRGHIDCEVRALGGGSVQVIVKTGVRYGPFVNSGTRRRPQGAHMFERGWEDSLQDVEARFQEAVHRTVEAM